MQRLSTAFQPTLTSICFLLIALRSAELSAAGLNATTHPTAAAAAPATAAATTPAKVTPAATTASVTTITTTKARKPRRLCAFPFWHRGQWHHKCLEYGSKGAQWCSLTQNFTRDEEWRECARYDLLRYKCAMPFHHGGKAHSECLPLGMEPLALPTYWCALVPSVSSVSWSNLGTDWTFCEAPNATDTEYLKAVGAYRILEEAEARKTTTAATTTLKATTVLHSSMAAVAAFVEAPKSISAAASGDGAPAAAGAADTGAAASGPGSGLGIFLGIAGVGLAVAAVVAAVIVHRRYFRHQYKRIDPLLSAEPAADKTSYGGMQAYHD